MLVEQHIISLLGGCLVFRTVGLYHVGNSIYPWHRDLINHSWLIDGEGKREESMSLFGLGVQDQTYMQCIHLNSL